MFTNSVLRNTRVNESANVPNTKYYSQCHDIGASTRALTNKRLCEVNDEFIPLSKGVINNDKGAENGFRDEAHFVNKIAQKIISTHFDFLNASKNLFKPGENPLLEKVVVFVPSIVCADPKTLEPNYAPFITNVKKKNSEGKLVKLEDVDFNNIVYELQQQKEISISPELSNNVYFLNDLLGAGIKIAHDIAQKPELILNDEEKGTKDREGLIDRVKKGTNEQAKANVKNILEGFTATIIMTGGGTGISTVEFLKDSVIVKSPEACHDFAIKMPESKDFINIKTEVARPPDAGAAARSFIVNFCNNIGIKDKNKINALIGAGLAQLVIEDKLILDDNEGQDSYKINLLSQTDLFDIKENGNKKEFSLKREYTGLNGEKFKKARNKAIEQYAFTIGELALSSLNRGENALIVTGPLALAINDYIQKNPEDFDKKGSLGELIEFKMLDFAENILHDGHSINAMKKYRRYRVICDKNKFNIGDNTEGSKILLNEKTEIIRGMWSGNTIKIPIDVLKDV